MITKKHVLFGNKVSKSNIKTKKKFYPNIKKVKVWSSDFNKYISLKISTKGLKVLYKKDLYSIS